MIQYKKITSFKGVRDFDAVLGDELDTLYIYYAKHFDKENPQKGPDQLYMAHVWSTEVEKDVWEWSLKVETSVPFDTNHRRALDSISCVLDDTKKGAMCAMNTMGTQIYAIDISFPPKRSERVLSGLDMIELGLIRYETYQKLAGWDGDELFITDKYIT